MFKHTLWYFLIRAGNGILSVAAIYIFTRLLTPKSYGLYSLAFALSSISSTFFFQWLNVSTSRFYPKYRDAPDVIFAAARRIYWTVVAIVAVLYLVALPFCRNIGLLPAHIFILFLITIIQARYDLSLQIVNVQGTPLRYGAISLTKAGISLLAGIVLIRLNFLEVGVLVGILLGLLTATIVFNPIRISRRLCWTEYGPLVKELFHYGLPLSFGFLAIIVVDMADRLMIGWLLGSGKVAPYAATYDLVQQSLGAIMNVLLLASMPAVVHALEHDGIDAAKMRLKTLSSAYIVIGLGATVGLAAISKDIVAVLLGEGIRVDSSGIIIWIAAAIFIGSFKCYYLDLSFQLSHKVKYLVYIAFVMAVTNLTLNLVLLPRYGVTGAAWASLFAFSLGALASIVVGRRFFTLPFCVSDLFKTVCACSLMIVSIMMLPLSKSIGGLVLKIFFGSILYLSLLLVLNVSSLRSKSDYRSIIKTFFNWI